MKSVRAIVLMLAVAAVSFNATQAFSQQEVDPDHYDQPLAAKPAAKTPAHKVSAGNHVQGRTTLVSKRAKQHHTHATAKTSTNTITLLRIVRPRRVSSFSSPRCCCRAKKPKLDRTQQKEEKTRADTHRHAQRHT